MQITEHFSIADDAVTLPTDQSECVFLVNNHHLAQIILGQPMIDRLATYVLAFLPPSFL